MVIPAPLVDTVFKTAIAACRARTRTHLQLPPGERFDLEYVKGTPWNAYNWYQGGYRSVIQVNLDFPIPLDRAVDLACHEGYPGHHVYNALLEQALMRGRGWVEISMYPLFSPQSLIAEGSANFGIDMAFPPAERVAFERDSLFPLARLDTSLAAPNAKVRAITDGLNYARNEVAREYLDGKLGAEAARRMMQRFWLITPDAAAKTLRFIDTYRSYVINYNLGRDLVAGWVQRIAGEREEARWRAFGGLLSAPHLPRDLTSTEPDRDPRLAGHRQFPAHQGGPAGRRDPGMTTKRPVGACTAGTPVEAELITQAASSLGPRRAMSCVAPAYWPSLTTFEAAGPLAPSTTSNSTRSPSARLLNPWPEMAE
jgi:hypothetical protein